VTVTSAVPDVVTLAELAAVMLSVGALAAEKMAPPSVANSVPSIETVEEPLTVAVAAKRAPADEMTPPNFIEAAVLMPARVNAGPVDVMPPCTSMLRDPIVTVDPMMIDVPPVAAMTALVDTRVSAAGTKELMLMRWPAAFHELRNVTASEAIAVVAVTTRLPVGVIVPALNVMLRLPGPTTVRIPVKDVLVTVTGVVEVPLAVTVAQLPEVMLMVVPEPVYLAQAADANGTIVGIVSTMKTEINLRYIR
jgi:hypothetical protein